MRRLAAKNRKRKLNTSESDSEDAKTPSPDPENGDDASDASLEENKISAKPGKGRKKTADTGSRSSRHSEKNDQDDAPLSRRKRAQDSKETDESTGDSGEAEGETGDEQFEVQEIIAVKMKKGKPVYRVRWVGYGPSSDTWELEEDLKCPDKLKAFKAKNEDKKEALEEDSKTDEESEKKEEYEVQEIVDMKMKKGKPVYKVRWVGYGPKEDTWENEDDLQCPDKLKKFKEKSEKNGKTKAAAEDSKNGKKKKSSAEDTKNDDVSETERDYEVEKVIEVSFKKNGKREFLIRWKGFNAKHDTWEPEENLNCPELIEAFMGKLDKIKGLSQRELRTNPKQTDHLSLSLAAGRHSRRLQRHPRRSYCGDFN